MSKAQTSLHLRFFETFDKLLIEVRRMQFHTAYALSFNYPHRQIVDTPKNCTQTILWLIMNSL